MKFFGDFEIEDSSDIISQFYNKSIPVNERIINLYKLISNNCFRGYLYNKNRPLGNFKLEVRINGSTLLPQTFNLNDFKFLDFYVELSPDEVNTIFQKSDKITKVNIFMTDANGSLKGKFKTIDLDPRYISLEQNAVRKINLRIKVWREDDETV